MPLDGISAAAAYQRIRLEEIRNLYGELDLDLNHYLNVEQETSKKLDSAEEGMSEVREMFSTLGVDLSSVEPGKYPAGAPVHSTGSKKYRKVQPGNYDNFQNLVEEAEAYLADAGIDPEKDPLLQVIGSTEIAGTAASYRNKYGDLRWDRSDYLAVTFAGFVATLLDIFLVKIPTDQNFLGGAQQGSPLTKWLREHSEEVHENFLERFEKRAKVPYDDSFNREVEGLSPKVHRLMSPGHDPILGFIFGVLDILRGTGTFIDKYGDVVILDKPPTDPVNLTAAFSKVFLHLLSDVCTSAGVQPPFFTPLQLVKADSPFKLKEGGDRVLWTDIARYMYVHGYDLRHFATMGLVPATVEMVIRGWLLYESYEKEEDPKLTKAKTASMLMLGHTIATSGNLLKTGVIYGMNPLALNWAQALRMFPVTISWIKESAKRDRRIETRLTAEWKTLHHAP